MTARVIVKTLVTAVTVSALALYGLACAACHNPGDQVDHRVGPPLGELNQRKAGSVDGYEYSAALSASTIQWNQAELTGWILDSDQRVPGSRMVYNNQLTIDEIQRLTIWLLAEQVK